MTAEERARIYMENETRHREPVPDLTIHSAYRRDETEMLWDAGFALFGLGFAALLIAVITKIGGYW